jgi:hypothetical protein
MSDINIFQKRKEPNGQRRYLLISETEVGKKVLSGMFVSTSEAVSIVLDDNSDLEKLINDFQNKGLTVEVY